MGPGAPLLSTQRGPFASSFTEKPGGGGGWSFLVILARSAPSARATTRNSSLGCDRWRGGAGSCKPAQAVSSDLKTAGMVLIKIHMSSQIDHRRT
jgi:hypothetical protein